MLRSQQLAAKRSQTKKRTTKKRDAERLRKFRTNIAMLKKAGLVSPKIDARSIKPTEHYLKIVREYSGVLSGRQRTVKLSKKFLDIAREDGKHVHNGHVIIDNNPGMRIIKDSRDPYGYHISHPSKGFEMIEHRGPRGRSLKKYAEYAESQMEPGGYIGFTVEGYRSNTLYFTVQEAVEAFERYYTMRFGSRREQYDIASSFTIYRVPKRLKWQWKPSRKWVGKGAARKNRRGKK